MIDILTVAFRDELPILKVQAQSVDINCQNLNPRNIYVIVNDDDEVATLIDKNWWGSFASRVKIIPRSVFSVGYLHPSGWVSQQIFKMLGASISYNPWTLVLDAKTIIVKEIAHNELVVSETISKQFEIPTHHWGPFRRVLGLMFNMQFDHMFAPAGVPFMFNNNIVREMISDVSKRIDGNFTDWFQSLFTPSEFLLYSAYVKYRYGIENISDSTTVQPYDVCNICHSEFDTYDARINAAVVNNKLLTLSVHRDTWARLSFDQKQVFINFLISKNITTAQELV